MNWQNILAVLVFCGAFMGWVIYQEVQRKLRSIDNRLTRLEGRFDERGYWESRRNGTSETE